MRQRRRIEGLWIYAVAFLAFVYGPVLLLPLFSLNEGNYATFPIRGLTLQHYAEMARNTSMLQALQNSLKVAVIVSVLSTAVSVPAALALSRYRLPGAGMILGFMSLPLLIPSIVIAVALLIILLRFLGVELSLWTVGAGHVLICIPFCMSVLMARLEGFDPNLEEASRDLGCNGWQTFLRLTLPLAMPGVVSSLLMGFVVSFDEFVVAFFLSGTQTTLPIFMYSQLRFPTKLPGMLALGTLVLLGSTLLVIVAEIIRRRGAASDNPGDI